tara:strand:+ start:57 stop:596 length:540 start_codon:yes stop_codon:yes gene_type:complete
MKIGITGHSRGIGKAIFDILCNDHDCQGFSISNGFHIRDNQDLIVQAVLKYDVFINNAYCGLEQVHLLNKVWDYWKKDSSKTIVNISSASKYTVTNTNGGGYPAHKAALSNQAFKLMFKDPTRKCRMINVNPGYVKTDMTARNVNSKMLTVDECANAVIWAVNQPQHIEIGELSIWRID